MITCPNCSHEFKDDRQVSAGKARQAKLTPEQRSEAGRKAASTRWFKTNRPELLTQPK